MNATTEEAQAGSMAQTCTCREAPRPESKQLWMRGHYTFAGLRNIAVLVRSIGRPIRPLELDRIVRERRIVVTKSRPNPSRTTLYHAYRALLNLGILERAPGGMVVTERDRLVHWLLQGSTQQTGLSARERQAFCSLVLRNQDCQSLWFRHFTPDRTSSTPGEFAEAARPVTWQRHPAGDRNEVVILRYDRSVALRLCSEAEVQAVLYGIRYWARDELKMVDEVFRLDVGNVVYPIVAPETAIAGVVRQRILDRISPDSMWTTLSVSDLIQEVGVAARAPVRVVLGTLSSLYRQYPGLVALIAIPRSLATLTAASGFRETYELRGYFRDEHGRYISHVRMHRDVKSLEDLDDTDA